jgi:hypothetical protein
MPFYEVITPLDRGDGEKIMPGGDPVELSKGEGDQLLAIGAVAKAPTPKKVAPPPPPPPPPPPAPPPVAAAAATVAAGRDRDGVMLLPALLTVLAFACFWRAPWSRADHLDGAGAGFFISAVLAGLHALLT